MCPCVQDRHRPEPVLPNDVGHAARRVLAGVDDHALGARPGGQDVAVGGPRTGRERGDQHGRKATKRLRLCRGPGGDAINLLDLRTVVSSRQRRRQLAREHYLRQQTRRAEKLRRARRRRLVLAVFVAGIAVIGAAVVLVRGLM